MTDLKTIPLQEFMAMPLDRKMVLMRHAFSKVENPILQFRCWREALAGWNVQRQDLSVELAALCEKHPDDRVWVAFQHLMILDSSTRFISQSDGTQRLALARNNKPEMIASIVEINDAAQGRYGDYVAQWILEIVSNLNKSGLSIVEFSDRMMALIGEGRWVEALVGCNVTAETLVGFFQRRVSWNYSKHPEMLHALIEMSERVLKESQKEKK